MSIANRLEPYLAKSLVGDKKNKVTYGLKQGMLHEDWVKMLIQREIENLYTVEESIIMKRKPMLMEMDRLRNLVYGADKMYRTLRERELPLVEIAEERTKIQAQLAVLQGLIVEKAMLLRHHGVNVNTVG